MIIFYNPTVTVLVICSPVDECFSLGEFIRIWKSKKSSIRVRFAALISHFAFLPPIMPGLIEIISISLKSRIDVFPDEVYFGLHIFDVCCGDYHGILVRNDKDVLTVCTVCPE